MCICVCVCAIYAWKRSEPLIRSTINSRSICVDIMCEYVTMCVCVCAYTYMCIEGTCVHVCKHGFD